MVSQHATSARTNLLLCGDARAARGNRRSMRAIGEALFGSCSRVRGHLESRGRCAVLLTGDVAAVSGFPDTGLIISE